VAIKCPEECQCDPGGSYGFKDPSLTGVPLIRLTHLRLLDIYRNDIMLLGRDSFVSLAELEVLRVWWSEQKTIEVGAFNGLTKLTSVYIYFN
jgi:hypothetical protein